MHLLLPISSLPGKLSPITEPAGVRSRTGTGPLDGQMPGLHVGNGEACGFLRRKNQPEAVGMASVPTA